MPDSPLTLIVAMTRQRLIGKAGKLPWRLPEELQLFKQITVGGTLIMGRRTWESLPAPLPQRRLLVVSRSLPPSPDLELFPTLNAALAAEPSRPCFIAGGADLYAEGLARADVLRISWIEGDYCGETYFPEFDLVAWEETERIVGTGFVHCIYRRKR